MWCECGVKYSGLLLIPHFNIVCCHWSYALCISRISKAYYLDIERERCSSGYQFDTGKMISLFLLLRNCLSDFDSFWSFCCFSYGHYNGILEGVTKSSIFPGKQMFWKFLGMQKVKQLSTLINHYDDFLSAVYEQFNWKLRVIIVDFLISHKHKIF